MMDYDQALSPRVQAIAPSGIRKFFDLLENMDTDDAISLGVGEPDFVTPWHIRDAGVYALEKGFTKYTSNAGLADLRREIAKYLFRRFELQYDPMKQMIVTVGGSEGIDIAVRAIVSEGDEVIVPVPSFVCYGPIVQLAGGVPVYVETRAENEFRLTADELRAAITPRTKLLILPFPNNPTGAILERADLEALAEVLRNTNIMVLSDEIYAELTYGGHHVSIANIPDMYDRTLVVNGFSKAYAMTGWRLGYVCGPGGLIRQMGKIHPYALMCAPPPPAGPRRWGPSGTATTRSPACGSPTTSGAALCSPASRRWECPALSPREPSTCSPTSPASVCPARTSARAS